MILESKGKIPNTPIKIFEIPTYIKKEIDGMVKESIKWKNHPLGELKAAENAAYKHPEHGKEYNTFQCNISPRLIEESLMMIDLIDDWIEKIARNYNPDEVRKYYSNNSEAMNNIQSVIVEKKTIDFVKSQASVKNKDYSFEDLMQLI